MVYITTDFIYCNTEIFPFIYFAVSVYFAIFEVNVKRKKNRINMHKKELIEQARYNRNYCMLTRKVFVFYLDGGKIKKKLSKIEGVEKNKYHDFFL